MDEKQVFKNLRSEIDPSAKIYNNAEIIDSIIQENAIIGNNAIINNCEIHSNTSINRYNYLLKSVIGHFLTQV